MAARALDVGGALLAVFVVENGLHISTDAEAVFAVEDELLWRVVDTSLVAGPDLDALSRLEHKVLGESVDDLTLAVDLSLELPLAHGFLLGAVGVLENDELAVGLAFGDGDVTLGRPLE